MDFFVWILIAGCLSQSAALSGLNLACFTLSRLELRIEAARGSRHARQVLALRENANFTLVTILWANVGVNVLLAMLSGRALAGVAAFFFSTVVITIFGEILPQAFFSRHALAAAARLAPLLRFYQRLLYPVARPTAWVLDRWLGPEGLNYFKEQEIRELLKLHMESSESDIERVEGQGALNFLALDDVSLAAEGEPLAPESIVRLPFRDGRPLFPSIAAEVTDGFLQQVQRSGKKWVVLVDEKAGRPVMVVDADEFIRDALFNPGRFNPARHCHRPIVAASGQTTIGELIPRLRVKPDHHEDDVVDHDVILLWGEERRVITGADVLGRLLRGIVRNPAGGGGVNRTGGYSVRRMFPA